MKPEQIDEWLIGIKNPADKMIAQLAILRAIEIEREEIAAEHILRNGYDKYGVAAYVRARGTK